VVHFENATEGTETKPVFSQVPFPYGKTKISIQMSPSSSWLACRRDAAREYVLQNGSGKFILLVTRLLSQLTTLHTFVPTQNLLCF